MTNTPLRCSSDPTNTVMASKDIPRRGPVTHTLPGEMVVIIKPHDEEATRQHLMTQQYLRSI